MANLATFNLVPTAAAELSAALGSVRANVLPSHNGEPDADHDIADLASDEAGLQVILALNNGFPSVQFWKTDDAQAEVVGEAGTGNRVLVIRCGDHITVIGAVELHNTNAKGSRLALCITTTSGDLQAKLLKVGMRVRMQKVGQGELPWIPGHHLSAIRKFAAAVTSAFQAWRQAAFKRLIEEQTTVVETAVMPIEPAEVVADVVPDPADGPMKIVTGRDARRRRAS